MNLTLSQILNLNYLGDALVVGGHRGLDHKVRLVNVMEVPDIFDWVSADELILTTGYPFKDNPDEMATLITKLSARDVAGIAVKTNRFIKELPEEAIRLADSLDFPIIALPSNAQFDKIILEILTKIINEEYHIIKKSREIHKTLTDLVLKGADFLGISQALSNLCFGEITLKDASGHILTQTKPTSIPPQFESADIDIYNVYTKQVQMSNQIVAYIILESWRKIIENTDFSAIDFAATIIAMTMFKIETDKEREKRHRNEFLNNLIFNRMQWPEFTVRDGKNYGIDLTIPYVAAIAKIHFSQKDVEASGGNDTLDNNIDKLIKSSSLLNREKYVCWNNSDGIVILCPVKINRDNRDNDVKDIMSAADEIKTFINQLVPDSMVTIGIGRYYHDISDIRKSYYEAQKATRIGELIWNDNGIYHYSDLGVYQLLSQFTDKEQLNDFIDDNLGSLIEYDNKKNSQLLLTLEHILMEENIRDIAKKLHVHPKTISFRKNRIKEILNFSLEDPEKRLSLSLALKLYRLDCNRTRKTAHSGGRGL